MADEHETESKAWAIEAAAAEAASRAAEEVHRPPVVPMERVVEVAIVILALTIDWWAPWFY